jgi:outer membrane protein OmpA-like peptidoglycan-associated protein
MSKTRTTLLATFLVVLLTWISPARAQIDRFQPALPDDHFFGVEGGARAVPQVQVLGDYGFRSLGLYTDDDQRIADLVRHRQVAHVGLAFGLWHRLLVGADMPLVLLSRGDDATVGSTSYTAPTGVAAGDLRVDLRVRLAGDDRSAATLSLGGHVFVPVGNANKLAGADATHGAPVIVLAGEGDHVAYAVNAGADLRKRSEFAAVTMGHQLIFGAAVAARFADRRLQVGPEVYGTTVMVGPDRFTRATTNIEGILGARVHLASLTIGVGAGPGFTRGMGTPALRALVSLAWSPQPTPPEQPVASPTPPPEEPAPQLEEIAVEPPPCTGTDQDRPECPRDRDSDGIPDAIDACPDLKGLPSDVAQENGCPPDSDGDGIRDDRDACPQEKGFSSDDASKHGCPQTVRLTDEEIVIAEQVQFRTDSARILAVSHEILRQVAAMLAAHIEVRKVEVQGHTDNRGGKQHNQKLSKRRAAAVKRWLVKQGHIERQRLTSRGYGMRSPLTDNASPESRQKNRRVQFKVLKKEER